MQNQTDIVLSAKSGASENQTLFRDNQSTEQKITLRMDTAAESAALVNGSDVLVTFNGPA